jgi:beta-lactamase regulating signal transducer with metallopeptidase domain
MALPAWPECADTINSLAPTFFDAAAKSLLILGLAGVATLALRRASAAARHWLWLLAFAGLLLLPLLSAALPGWAILPPLAVRNAALPAPPVAPGSDVVAAPLPTPAPAEDLIAAVPVEATVTTPQHLESAALAASSNIAPLLPSADLAATPSSRVSTPLPWAAWLVLAWLLGTLLLLVYMLLGYLSLWSLQRRSTPLTQGDWPDLLFHLRRVLGLQRAVLLLNSPLRTMPMTWGLLRTRLLLPAQASDWPFEQRRAVLLHELAHVQRWDCLTQLLAQIACALYWFNPVVWIAWRRLHIERERACDDLVLNTGARPSAYAQHLLQSASALPPFRLIGAAALAMARPSTLEQRLHAILDSGRNRRALSTRAALAAFLLLLGVLVPVAVLRAQAARTPTAPSTSPTAVATPADATPGGPNRGTTDLTGNRGVAVAAAITTPDETTTCSLDATIYEVHLPADQISRLDVEALSRASTTVAGFEKALAALGSAVPLYRANQSVRLAGDTITIGTNTPYVTNSQVTNRGQVVNSVAYARVGASFGIAGKPAPAGRLEIDLTIQVSTLDTSDSVPISTNVIAPMFRTVSMAHKGFVAPRQPLVIINASAAPVNAAGQAVACIARISFGAPRSGNSPARGD